MKQILKTNLIGLLATATFLTVLSINTYAFEYPTGQMQTSASSEVGPQAEETGYMYKIMNGKQYKRLWSYTYARWIDKDWILIS
ncbi:MAG: hypothetical protein QM657_04060 [Lacrimispora sp.]|uniref:hypothetical protein n=1 Tax=Lacrimispora sp. TaxID=2719234 RepID=UPI0039E475E1